MRYFSWQYTEIGRPNACAGGIGWKYPPGGHLRYDQSDACRVLWQNPDTASLLIKAPVPVITATFIALCLFHCRLQEIPQSLQFPSMAEARSRESKAQPDTGDTCHRSCPTR